MGNFRRRPHARRLESVPERSEPHSPSANPRFCPPTPARHVYLNARHLSTSPAPSLSTYPASRYQHDERNLP